MRERPFISHVIETTKGTMLKLQRDESSKSSKDDVKPKEHISEIQFKPTNAIASISQMIHSKMTGTIPSIIANLLSEEDKRTVLKATDYRVFKIYAQENMFEDFKFAFALLTEVEKLEAMRSKEYIIPRWAAIYGNVDTLKIFKSLSDTDFKTATQGMLNVAAIKNQTASIEFVVKNTGVEPSKLKEMLAISLTKKRCNRRNQKLYPQPNRTNRYWIKPTTRRTIYGRENFNRKCSA
jgi:hypothetical protein